MRSSTRAARPAGRRKVSAAAPSASLPRRSTASRLPLAAAAPRSAAADFVEGLAPVAARSCDHALIHHFLTGVFHAPSPAEFQAQLDMPGYDPSDRLVVWRGTELIAHVRVAQRELRLGRETVPVAVVMDLATALPYRGCGLASQLLVAAERRAREQRSCALLARTHALPLFTRHGWSPLAGPGSWSADARSVLAELTARRPVRVRPLFAEDDGAAPRGAEPLNIRQMRRLDQPAIMRLYEQNTARGWGAWRRTEAYWDWLLHRGACERSYVAVEGPGRFDLGRAGEGVVGYAFESAGRIVELGAAAGRCDVAQALLARVCAETMERGGDRIRLDVPQGDPLGEVIRAAGGARREYRPGGESAVWLGKALQPAALLAAQQEELAERAQAAQLPEGWELQLAGEALPGTNGKPGSGGWRLSGQRRSVRVQSGGVSRPSLVAPAAELGAALLGGADVAAAFRAGRWKASSRAAQRAVEALFPPAPLFFPPLDDLLA